MICQKTSFFGVLLLFTPLFVNAHYGPDYTPPVESSRARSLSLQSQQSTASNPYDYLIQDSSGATGRWVGSDDGSKIKYYLDVESRPGSFTIAQCKNAAVEAFQAWTDICGVDFIFSGFMPTREPLLDFFQNNDGFDDSIIIQMHETYTDRTPEESYLAAATSSRWAVVGSGGKFKGVEFNKTLRGRIYFNHDKPYWYNASFEKLVTVFKHEIGHVLGLRHSNYDPTTGEDVHMPALTAENSYQRQSIMYYASYDGIDFGQWDYDHIKLLYDKTNHVPFSNSDYSNESFYVPYDSYYSDNSINYFTFDAGDLDNDLLSIIELPDLGFYNNSNIDYYFENQALELRYRSSLGSTYIAKGDYYRFAYRVEDSSGNMSPIYYLRIRELIADNDSNGISDIWESAYNISPSSRDSDTDGDLVSDYNEYLTDTDPTDSSLYDPTLRELGLAQNSIDTLAVDLLVAEAERDARLTIEEVRDARIGSTMIEVTGNEATIQLKMEESSDLESGSWTEVEGSATMTVPVPTDSDTKFYRFKLDD